MSAYFESLNRRVSTAHVASGPALAPALEPGVVHPAQPVRVAARRLAPGAVPSAYALLRERLMLAAQGKTLKSLLFAGCNGGEGCTQVVCEFAESLASAGLNVLLVDADIRTAGVTSSIAARGGDLSELVRTKDVPPAIPWGRGRLTIVPRPTALTDKETFLRSPDLAFWLDKQRVTYDYTFLDAPPILGHADGTLAGLFCDGVVLVAKAGVTRGDALARARQQIEHTGGKALGVVLTQVRNPIPDFLRRYLRVD